MDRRIRGAVLVGLIVLASIPATGPAAAAPPDDPETDVIGWEDGYWHNETIDVDQRDGLSDGEREAYVARTMARVEVLRDREFTSSVPVEVIPRSEYGDRTTGNTSDEYRAWNNQVWEALFIVGEDVDVIAALHATSTASTTGGYFFNEDEIKIITDTPAQPVIGRATLAHELVHAQQDQYQDLTNVTANNVVQDEQLAVNGLIEGEADYIESRYQARCGVEWECVPDPTSSAGGSGDDVNTGILVTLLHPYSDGPPYVNALVEEEGWSAVEASFGAPPRSTEQIIHHVDEEPTPLAIDDEATAGWTPSLEQGRNGTDTAGEASMFTMFWFQAAEYDADTVRPQILFDTNAPYDSYNYDADPSAGWGNDVILPYHRETADGSEGGYVWVSEWDTVNDAIEFRGTYLQVLAAHDARRLGPRTLVIDEGPFADAFRIHREGRRVTIVNAPAVSDLSDLRPSIEGVDEDPMVESPSDVVPDSPFDPEVTPVEDGGVTTAPEQPGFGVLVALTGLVGWTLLRWRRGP